MASYSSMVFLFVVFSLFVVFLVLVIVISLANKQRDNTDQESESYERYKKRELKSYSTVSPSVVVFFLAIVVGIFFTVRIVAISNTVQSLQNQVNSLNQSLWQSNNSISSLRSELEELQIKDEYIERFSYDFVAVTDEGQGIIDLTIYMKKLPTEGTVNLVIENSESDITMIELMSDTMIYYSSLTLDMDESYDLSVVVVDGEETLREELRTLDMNRLLNEYRGIKIEEDWEDETFTFVFTVYNNYSLNELLAFKEIWVEEYNEDGVFSTKLLTVPDVDVNYYEEYHFNVLLDLKLEYNLMIKITGVDYFGHEVVLFNQGF